MHVLIDGIRYVPERESKPLNSLAIKRALLDNFWGCTSKKSEKEIDELWRGVRIVVSDSLLEDGWNEDQTLTIQELLANINELLDVS